MKKIILITAFLITAFCFCDFVFAQTYIRQDQVWDLPDTLEYFRTHIGEGAEGDSLLKIDGNTYTLGYSGSTIDSWLDGLNTWTTGLSGTSSLLRLGLTNRQLFFNNGAYSDFWLGGFVTIPYNLPHSNMNAFEFRTDYNNDTLKPFVNFYHLLYLKGTGTPIWDPVNRFRYIAGYYNQAVGDLPDSTGLNWAWDDWVAGVHTQVGDEFGKTATPTRFPMPVYGYRFRFVGTPSTYYTYPYMYSFYSDFTKYAGQGKIEQGWHFYGKGDFPSYFGGDVNVEDTVFADALTIDSTYTLPDVDGTVNQVIKTDGAGNLTWQTDAGGAGSDSATYVYHDSRWVIGDSLITFEEAEALYGAGTDTTHYNLISRIIALQDSLNTYLHLKDSTLYATQDDIANIVTDTVHYNIISRILLLQDSLDTYLHLKDSTLYATQDDINDFITGNESITLSGDATGSGTTAITVTVADDSHNHIYANIDGLEDSIGNAINDSSLAGTTQGSIPYYHNGGWWENVNYPDSSESDFEAVLDLQDLQGAVDSATIGAEAISEIHLKATNSPTDNYIPSYDDATKGFTWVVDATGGAPATADITDVSVTQTELAELETIGATTISANQWALLGGVAETLGSAELNLLDGETDIANQAELDAVAALVDTDDKIIAIINASPSTQIGVPAGGTGVGTFTDHGILLGSGTGAITVTGEMPNGNLLIGETGSDPSLATLTPGDGIDISNGAASITITVENASTTNEGMVELATTAETTTGTDETRVVTPNGLEDGFDGSTNIITLGTITTGVWTGTDIADADVADDITITNISQVGDITATAAEINYTTNVTSDIQTQFEAKADTLSYWFPVMDTVTVQTYPGIQVESNITIVRISAYCDANTVTFNLEERGATTPNTAGTDVMASDLVADTNTEVQTSFSNANITKSNHLTLTVSATGDVAIFGITVWYIKQSY